MRPIRIANSSGFLGDRTSAISEIVEEGGIDVITGDYLSEVTMLVLAKLRARKPEAGYAATFRGQIEPVLGDLAERGIKVVTNAGGLNPHGLASELRKLIAGAGVDLAVAVVDGDDVSDEIDRLARAGATLPHLRTGAPLDTWGHEVLTANAYLGAWGIVAALDAGADIVITGRTTDASLVVGPAAWWHRWDRSDFDQLAGAVVAGHVIECGTQATGGNYSGFARHAALGRPSYPIAAINADGSSVISKAAGGGCVTVGTVTAQLMYEIDRPEYANPDVVARFDTVHLDQVDDDEVAISATKGMAPPPTTKVAITALGGFRNSHTVIMTGLNLAEKLTWFQMEVRAAAARIGGIESIEFESLGTVAEDPKTQGDASMIVRCIVTGDERSVGRPFGASIVELALANFPGFYGLSLPGSGQEFGTYWPAVVPQELVEHRVTLPDGTVLEIAPPEVTAPDTSSSHATDDDPRWEPVPTRLAALGLVADARSGDKGGDANVGIWVRDLAHWRWLRDSLSAEVFRGLVPEATGLVVDRYELANVGALNFVIRDLLGEGATASVRIDKQAKALGEYLLAKHVEVPVAFLAGASSDVEH